MITWLFFIPCFLITRQCRDMQNKITCVINFNYMWEKMLEMKAKSCKSGEKKYNLIKIQFNALCLWNFFIWKKYILINSMLCGGTFSYVRSFVTFDNYGLYSSPTHFLGSLVFVRSYFRQITCAEKFKIPIPYESLWLSHINIGQSEEAIHSVFLKRHQSGNIQKPTVSF